MDLKKWSPWNWFKKEQEQEQGNVPVSGTQQQPVNNPVNRLHQEIDRVFDEAFRGFGLPSLNLGDQPGLLQSGWLKPSVDINEKDKHYIISVEVPGVNEDDLHVDVAGDTLTIRGEKKQEDTQNEGNYHRVERSYGAFQRVLTLPDDADRDNIKAKFKNGILTLTVDKTEPSKREGKRIEIESDNR